jgi:hypothetical protein
MAGSLPRTQSPHKAREPDAGEAPPFDARAAVAELPRRHDAADVAGDVAGDVAVYLASLVTLSDDAEVGLSPSTWLIQ